MYTLIMYLLIDWILVLLLYIRNYSGIELGLKEYFGLLFGLSSFVFWIVSRVQLGHSFSAKPMAKELITTGLYSKIKHPIYVFSSLSILGAILPSRSLLQYGLFATLVVIQIIRSSKESAVLTNKFGEKYSRYVSQTWF
jgi:protein-S-isoprenylcysteine O-methyltransferase Ste14